ncbi:energy transducer TonB [Flavobacterium lindanitolerans]|uniref:energy transducer TonB n=1 Tax=Flavobacterium lindanitolerans TaxID=428988 RepID=UPI002808C434|nr:energy transducer TonB [Flavobacterium lindanitolerans]MDQ7959918.1 energy transducer TonB [Flavobacterium lindanitolerans]
MFKRFLFSIVLSMTFSMVCIAQETETAQNPTSVAENAVAVFPKFQGGDHKLSLSKYAKKHYVMPNDFQGKGVLIVDFTIDTKGKVKNIRVINDLGYGSAESAIKLLKNMPRWTPAYNANGEPIEFINQLKITMSNLTQPVQH